MALGGRSGDDDVPSRPDDASRGTGVRVGDEAPGGGKNGGGRDAAISRHAGQM